MNTLDRARAADLLRAARRAPDDDAGDSIGWAFSLMPDSPAARRLRINLLLKQGDLEAADALIAQGLLRRPTNAALSLLRARSLFARGLFERADRELRLVLAKRPEHRGALELAGKVSLGLGDPLRACAFLGRADRGRGRQQIKAALVKAWIAAGQPARARGVLSDMTLPSPLIRARVLRAEGRILEAIDSLDEARHDESRPDHDAILGLLIELLEETADAARLAALLEPIGTDRPEVLARAGTAWLGMGAFRTTVARMARLARVPGYQSRALAVILVAASMMNRGTLAARTLRRLRRATDPVDRDLVVEAWSRGLLGRLMLDQRSARKAGADPNTGRLEQLLRDAAHVFTDDLEQTGRHLAPAERTALKEQLSLCSRIASEFDDEPAQPAAAAA